MRWSHLSVESAGFPSLVHPQPQDLGPVTLDDLPDPVLWCGEEGRIATANEAACSLLGYDRAELPGLTVDQVAPWLPGERWAEVWQVVEEEGTLTFDSRFRARGGAEVDVELSVRHVARQGRRYLCVAARPVERQKAVERELQHAQQELEDQIRSRTAELAAVNAELRDEIRERRRMEEALRASDTRYRMIAGNVTDIVWTMDVDGRLTYVSPSVQRTLGYAEPDVMYRHVRRLVRRSSFREGTRKLRRWLAADPSQTDFTISLDLLHADGRTVPCETSLRVLRDAEGRVAGWVGVLRDVTERRQMEQALIRSERMAAAGTLAGGIAHEFNNLNAAMLGYAELCLMTRGLSPDLRQKLERICSAALRAKGITANLLSFVAGKCDEEACFASLVGVVEDVLELKEKDLEAAGVEVERRLEDVPETRMHPGQIGQVLLNLLTNAEHALLDSARRRIVVETGVAGDRVFVAVRDTGCGIPAESLTKIFSPFYSTKGEHAEGGSSQAQVRGTGLGWAVSHPNGANHDGELAVESTPGEGTTFRVLLPLIPQQPGRRTAGRPAGEARRVVLLEDERDVREMLVDFLRGRGFEVNGCATAEEAFEVVRRLPTDLAIVDLHLPSMGGVALLERFREVPEAERPQVIVISGRPAGLELDGDGLVPVFRVLEKPFRLGQLASSVDEALAAR